VTDLAAAYARCRELNARHGRTFFLATRLLTPAQRPAVHALYGFARWADEIVDSGTSTDPAGDLEQLEAQLADELAGRPTGHPVLAALADTVRRYSIDQALFVDFLASMRMDLTVTSYPDFAALDRYVHGSAAVIGLQLLPVFGTVVPRAEAEPPAAALGRAFQLTNFLRDVREDTALGRVYLPGGTDRGAVAEGVARARAAFDGCDAAVRAAPGRVRPGIRLAVGVYRSVLDRIEALDFDVHRGSTAARPGRVASAALGALRG
jgi:15-cis-phytoene synthase